MSIPFIPDSDIEREQSPKAKALAKELTKIYGLPSNIDIIVVDEITMLYFGPDNHHFEGSNYSINDLYKPLLAKEGMLVERRKDSLVQFKTIKYLHGDIFVTYYSFIDNECQSSPSKDILRETEEIIRFEEAVGCGSFAIDVYVMDVCGNANSYYVHKLSEMDNVNVHFVVEEKVINSIVESNKRMTKSDEVRDKKRLIEKKKSEEKFLREMDERRVKDDKELGDERRERVEFAKRKEKMSFVEE